MFKDVEMRTAQDNQDIIDALEKEITEKNVRILELEKFKEEQSQISCAYCGQLCARDVDELVKHIENCEKHPVFRLTNEKIKLEKQNARMRECLCRIIEFENCENHFMTYTSSVAKNTLKELEGEE